MQFDFYHVQIVGGDLIRRLENICQASGICRSAAVPSRHEPDEGEVIGLVEQSIDALPEPFREVFVLRELEGFSVEETAQLLALAPETVKTRLHRARTRLRQTLQDQLARALQDTFPFEGVRCRRLSGAVLRRLALSPGPT